MLKPVFCSVAPATPFTASSIKENNTAIWNGLLRKVNPEKEPGPFQKLAEQLFIGDFAKHMTEQESKVRAYEHQKLRDDIETAKLTRERDDILNPPKPPSPPPPKPQLSRAETCAKERAKIDAQMDWVNADAAERKKKYPERADFIENQRKDTLHQLEKERSKWLY